MQSDPDYRDNQGRMQRAFAVLAIERVHCGHQPDAVFVRIVVGLQVHLTLVHGATYQIQNAEQA